MLDQFKRQLVTYPSVPAIVLARLVSAGNILGGSLVGAFVDDELRGVQVTRRVNGESVVALVVHAEQKEVVGFKFWNGTTQSWLGIQETLTLDSGDVHGSADDKVRLTLDEEPLVKGLVLTRDSMRLVVAPELLGIHKLQRSKDLINWADYLISETEREAGLTIDPNQSHEFYRLISR